METLDEYMKRRELVRAKLTNDDGENNILVQAASGKIPPLAPPPRSMLYQPGFMMKRQAD